MERSQNKVAQDNGFDRFNYNQSFFATSGTVTTLTYNLLSALPMAGAVTVYADFDAYTTPPYTGQKHISRGGSWDAATYAAGGRFNLNANSYNGDGTGTLQMGFRCAH